MHTKTVLFFITAFFSVFVSANPPSITTITATPPPATVTTISQCNTGDSYCCNSVQQASSDQVSLLLGLLGVVLDDPTRAGLVGLQCTPISLVDGGATCDQQLVCCTDNQFNGIINIGCVGI